MPLKVRSFQPSDGMTLCSRFASETRPLWFRLPPAYRIDALCEAPEGLTLKVLETSPESAVGLIAIDERTATPTLVGPLLWADQLADLYGHALLTAALQWAAAERLEQLHLKVDLDDDHILGFFLNQGFKLSGEREYLLSAARGSIPAPEAPDGVRVGLSPDMLSSDYLALYGEIGTELGWRERLDWSRPAVFEHLQRPDVLLFAARTGSTYLGFAELVVRETSGAELILFGVRPAFRGRGIATALLSHVLWHCTELLGHDRVWFTTQSEDGGRLRFTPARHALRQERVLIQLEKRLIEVPSGRYAPG
ncbi:MAG: GNAT family N-acetyltransferase [Candidatus Sericytochromatia bacterium]|nr:GNAT family N-acetyltransferase [Candidatus Sericytochromatia bacterium]